VLAAHRAGLHTVIIPADNQKDLEEIPVEIRAHMIFAPVGRIAQVLVLALEPEAPSEAVPATPASAAAAAAGSVATESVVARGGEGVPRGDRAGLASR
jgi:predicted ATP-dependent protease